MALVLILTLIVIVLVVWMNYETTHADLTYVTSTVDGRQYLVRNRVDKMEAANLLANIRSNLKKLVEYLRINYISDDKVSRLVSKFDPILSIKEKRLFFVFVQRTKRKSWWI
jgi:hypothetical protein